MIKKLKNTTGSTRTYHGEEIEAGTYYEVQKQELDLWLANATIDTDITSGDLMFNDGTSDYAVAADGLEMWHAVDATCIKGKLLDDGDIANNCVPCYDSVSGKLTYADHDGIDGAGSNTHAQIDTHLGSTSNPHSVDKADAGLGNCDNTADSAKPVSTAQQTALDAKVDDSEKGAANGVATLDGTGKVPSSQLTLSSVTYQGAWDAVANTPTLSDSGGGGSAGDYYVVSVTGTTSIDGISDWAVGDWIINNGSVWEKNDNTDQVTSVAGKQGAVTLDADDVSETASKKWLSSTDKTKLDGIETAATADQSDGEIKTAYENNSDTNAFTDARKTKVDHLSVTQAVNLDTIESDTATNNAKTSNATHTGEVTGATSLALDKTAVTNKSLVSAASGDHVLIADATDSDNLKRVNAADFLSGGDSSSVCDNFTKSSHGLAVGDVVRHSGANPEDWTKAKSDAAANSEATGIITAVAGNDFTVCYSGSVSGLTGLTADEVHFLSSSTDGGLTTTEPTISKPILFATSATTAVVSIQRAMTGAPQVNFGEAYEYDEDESDTNTVSASYVTKSSHVTAALESGDYRVAYNFEGYINTSGVIASFEIKIDGTVIGEMTMEGDNDWHSFSGFKKINLSGAKTIYFNYKSGNGVAATHMRRARLELWRIT